jgi:transcriptional regulator with XRE-family HTH domain
LAIDFPAVRCQDVAMTQRVVSGAAIKAIREAHGLSVRDLATDAGLDAAQLSRFENGKRTPSEDQAQKIADALRVPLAAISFATRVVVIQQAEDAA